MKKMSKTKLLLDVAEGMRVLADSIQAVAEALMVQEPTGTIQPELPTVPSKPAPKPVTLEQVRAVLADKSQAGFTAEVRSLLEKYGATKLSQIDPVNYAALLADAEALS